MYFVSCPLPVSGQIHFLVLRFYELKFSYVFKSLQGAMYGDAL